MAGRPTNYKDEYADHAKKLCKLGFTDAELADFFDVNESTINRWKEKHSEFCKSLKEGKEIADAEVVEKLYQRAIGYEHPETKVFNSGKEVVTYDVTRHYPPDPTAMIYWLKNRQPTKWRDRPAEHSGDEIDKIAEAIRSLK